MASSHVYDAVKSHLQTAFTPTPVLDIDSIEDVIQQGEEPFIVLEDGSANEDQVCMGGYDIDAGMLETGTITVYAFVRAPESSNTARAFADQIRDEMRLRGYNSGDLGGVRIPVITPVDVSESNNGRWTVGVLTAGYEYDFYAAVPSP